MGVDLSNEDAGRATIRRSPFANPLPKLEKVANANSSSPIIHVGVLNLFVNDAFSLLLGRLPNSLIEDNNIYLPIYGSV